MTRKCIALFCLCFAILISEVKCMKSRENNKFYLLIYLTEIISIQHD